MSACVKIGCGLAFAGAFVEAGVIVGSASPLVVCWAVGFALVSIFGIVSVVLA